MKLKVVMGVIVLFCFLCSFVFAQQDRLQQLEKKIERQQQILQNLESKINKQEKDTRDYTEKLVKDYMETYADEEEGGIVAGYDKGFFIQSADGDYKFKINGYIRQHLFIAENNTVQNNTYIPSEARIDFHFYYKKDWHVRIRPDFAANGSLREGYIEYLGIPSFKPRLGAWIVPFAREYMNNPPDLLSILYSPYLNPVPFRDVGAMIYGDGLPFLPLGDFSKYFSYGTRIK